MRDYRDIEVFFWLLGCPGESHRGNFRITDFINPSSPQQIDALDCHGHLSFMSTSGSQHKRVRNLPVLEAEDSDGLCGTRVAASPNGHSHCATHQRTDEREMLGFLRWAGQKPSPPLPPLCRTVDDLQIVAGDTVSRTPEIISATPGVSADSTFHPQQLPPLNRVARPAPPSLRFAWMRPRPLGSIVSRIP